MDTASFDDFPTALAFLKRMKTGVITRGTARTEYEWTSEGAHLSEDQRSLLKSHNGEDAIWTDPDTGLTWILQTAQLSFSFRFDRPRFFAGHNDWRTPTVTELKTLRSSVKNEYGAFVKSTVPSKLTGAYTCSTAVRKGSNDDGMTWNYTSDCFGEVQHREGKIQWSATGGFAGFEPDRTSGEGSDIYVRGERARIMDDWCEDLVQWAEQYDYHNFPVTLETIQAVESLRIWKDAFPPHMSKLESLRKIHIHHCTVLPLELFKLRNLEELIWEGDYYRQKGACVLAEEIGELISLRSLTIKGIKLASLPLAIGDLQNLRKLQVSLTDINAIPETIGQLTNLEELVLTHNEMTEFPAAAAGMRNLKDLTLSDRALKVMPDIFAELVKLERLVLDYSPIGTIPQGVLSLLHLKGLSASWCSLTWLPPRIVELRSLQELNISFNKVDTLPTNIGRMSELETLSCAATLVEELPETLRESNTLKRLNISGTPLRVFPEWIAEIPSLTHIIAAKLWYIKKLAKYEGKEVRTYLGQLNQPAETEWLKSIGYPEN
jgi:hypothetical protein